MWLYYVIGATVIIVLFWILKESYRLSHCPDCGHKLSGLKENDKGWLYKDCPNAECTLQQVGFQNLLEG